MEQFSKFLKSLDNFGVQLTQQYSKAETKYRTKIGGCVTIVIYILSAMYTFYIFIQWIQGQITPKISNQSYISDFSMLDLNYDLIKVSYWGYGENLIDPFSENVLSLSLFFWSGDFNETIPLTVNRSDPNLIGYAQAQPDFKLNFQEVDGQLQLFSDFYVLVTPCNQTWLPDGEECADQETVDAFYKQKMNCLEIDIRYRRLNPMSANLEETLQQYYVQFEDIDCQTQYFLFKTKYYEVKNSLLFGSPILSELVDDVSNTGFTNSVEYCKNIFDVTTYVIVYLSLTTSQSLTRIEFSNLGELLANIGSVVSLLFLSKYVLYKINAHYFERKVMNELISYYYPEFNNIIIKYNWKNQIVEVRLGDKTFDPADFNRFLNNATNIMKTKLSTSNMLYEMSRLQFIVRSMQTKQEIMKVHQCGIRLRIKSLNDSNTFELQQNYSDETMNDEELDLLIIDKKNQNDYSQPQQDIEQPYNDFYTINKINLI